MTIQQAFRTLELAGCRPPYDSAESVAQAETLWRKTIGDVDLDPAVTAWLQGDKGRFWPSPGQLRRLLPRAAPKPVDDGEDWHGRRWSRLADGHQRIAIIDQAVAENSAARACGATGRCDSECRPCMDAVLRRCDELAVSQ